MTYAKFGDPFMTVKKITVLTPCFNEEAAIEECYRQVRLIMDRDLPQYDFEHLFIDNCSSDQTVTILKKIAACDRRVKLIVNSRNFGLSRSPYYGILHSTGDAVITIVADLQTPPRVIPEMVSAWQSGFPLVIGVRKGMSESWIVRALRSAFYSVISKISRIEQIPHFIGFGLFDRKIIDVLREFDDPTPYFRGMIAEIGFERKFVEYIQPPRAVGISRHSLFDLIDYAMLGFVTYSNAPLRFMTLIGLCASVLSFLVTAFYVAVKVLFWNNFPVGMAPILVGMFFFASLQFLFLGILGEYVGAIHERLKRRPLVIEKERVNFE
jgi:glycosyltransferase involved in cell wall biosynthesis